MESIRYKVLNIGGDEVGEMELDPEVFNAKECRSLVHQTVRWQRACRRAGSHSVLSRGNMKGGGKKPWRQKGTGRARAGTRNSPVWVGGAVAHGPQPRDYSFRLSARSRRQALASVLSSKVKANELIILDELPIKEGKTREIVSILDKLGVKDTSSLLVTPTKDEMLRRSSGNLKRSLALPVIGANVYDLLRHRYLLCTKESVSALVQRVKGSVVENS